MRPASSCCPGGSTPTAMSMSRPSSARGWQTASRAQPAAQPAAARQRSCPFVNQLPGATLREAVEDYRRKASPAIIDYALHVLLTSVSPQLLGQDVPALMADGLRSYKVFMTYPGFMLDDAAILEVMACVREGNGTVMVHAENGHCVHWLANQFESRGETELAAFAAAAPVAVEREACHRAITLAELTGARLLLVHISSVDAMDQIGWARARGLRVLAETCPQYLLAGMSAEEHGQTGWEGAKSVCAPPPRGSGEAEELWASVALGAFRAVVVRPLPLPFRGNGWEAGARRTAAAFSPCATRLARAGNPPAPVVRGGRRQGAHRPKSVCSLNGDAAGPNLWPLSRERVRSCPGRTPMWHSGNATGRGPFAMRNCTTPATTRLTRVGLCRPGRS